MRAARLRVCRRPVLGEGRPSSNRGRRLGAGRLELRPHPVDSTHPSSVRTRPGAPKRGCHISRHVDAERSTSSRPIAAARSTFHGPGQLVCYPILDLTHGKDVKRYVRDLERRSSDLAAFELEGVRYEGLTGVWIPPADGSRAAEDRVDRRPRLALGDDARLRAQRRPRPGAVHGVDHCLRARGRTVHDHGARARTASRRRGRPSRRRSTAIAEVFELQLEALPADDGAGLWSQRVHQKLAAR